MKQHILEGHLEPPIDGRSVSKRTTIFQRPQQEHANAWPQGEDSTLGSGESYRTKLVTRASPWGEGCPSPCLGGEESELPSLKLRGVAPAPSWQHPLQGCKAQPTVTQ